MSKFRFCYYRLVDAVSGGRVYPDVAELCLGHVIKGVRATYDRHEYYAEKLHAFEALAGQIERRRGSA